MGRTPSIGRMSLVSWSAYNFSGSSTPVIVVVQYSAAPIRSNALFSLCQSRKLAVATGLYPLWRIVTNR